MTEGKTLYDRAIDRVLKDGQIRDGHVLTRILVDLARMGCLVAEPMKSAVIPDDYIAIVTVTPTEPLTRRGDDWFSPHWETSSSRGAALSPKLTLLDEMAAGAGVTTVTSQRVRSDNPREIQWREVGERRDLAGRTVRREGDRLETGGQHAMSMAQSRARKRMIRSILGVSSQYDRKYDGVPVVTCRIEYSPVKGDAEFDSLARKARLANAYGLNAALYGTPGQPAQIEAPSAEPTQDAERVPEPTTTQTKTEQIAPPDDLAERKSEMKATASAALKDGLTKQDLGEAAAKVGLDRDDPTNDAMDRWVAELKAIKASREQQQTNPDADDSAPF